MSEGLLTFKILTIGESGVGKTCILRRYVENKFLKNHLATIGIDFKTKNVVVNSKEIKLKIWDTAGQDRFRNITNQYYKGADGIFLVFDLTDRSTFEKIENWMKQITANTHSEEIGLVLLGNKCDSEGRVVQESEGIDMATTLGIKYFETSALNGYNINESFQFLTEEIMRKKNIFGNTTTQNGSNVKLSENNNKQTKKKDSCC